MNMEGTRLENWPQGGLRTYVDRHLEKFPKSLLSPKDPYSIVGKVMNKPVNKIISPVDISRPRSQAPHWLFDVLICKVAMEVEMEPTDGLKDIDFPSPRLTWRLPVLRPNLQAA